MKKNQGFLQISFGWMFAIIVGIFIIFLAIFAVSRFIGQGQTQDSAVTSEAIGILLNPLETGFEESTSTSFSLAKETKIFNSCDTFGNFGNQILEAQQESFDRFAEGGIENKFKNKYIFSSNPLQGKEFLLFSKPLTLPFKITDLVYFTSTNEMYCFVNPPERIEKELQGLNQQNLQVIDCAENAKTVCFGTNQNCDIRVDENQKSVEKGRKTVYYEQDALMYAAIFSEKEEYECNIQRISKRASSLAKLYEGKASLLTKTGGCSNSINVFSLKALYDNLEDSSDLFRIAQEAEDLDKENDFNFRCSLW